MCERVIARYDRVFCFLNTEKYSITPTSVPSYAFSYGVAVSTERHRPGTEKRSSVSFVSQLSKQQIISDSILGKAILSDKHAVLHVSFRTQKRYLNAFLQNNRANYLNTDEHVYGIKSRIEGQGCEYI